MSILEIFLIGIGLSMDAFAVAICKGLAMKRFNLVQAALIALFFGGFQALMPAIGWLLGSSVVGMLEAIDHWIAFALLALVGSKMLWDAFHEDADASDASAQTDRVLLPELLMLAIATSIDALAVGVGFAFLDVAIAAACLLIGCTTFVLSFAGVYIGNRFGSRWEKPATIAGGVVLVVIGFKILLEHLGLIGF